MWILERWEKPRIHVHRALVQVRAMRPETGFRTMRYRCSPSFSGYYSAMEPVSRLGGGCHIQSSSPMDEWEWPEVSSLWEWAVGGRVCLRATSYSLVKRGDKSTHAL